ncbi:MAG: glycosyltransferase family 4 protein [candidate division Zixibacteria bacterium]|nr:glycosyltransferase family 4 protein [candidate division Zixibacteria bacterium]
MRILAVNWQDLTNPQAGGAEVHLEEILRRLVSWGHEVSLACSNYPGGKERETIVGVQIWRRGSRSNFNFVAPLLVKRILKDKPHDIIVEDINKIPFYLPLFFDLPHLVVIPHLFGTSVFSEVNPILASYVYLAEKPIRLVYRRSNYLVISNSTKDDLVKRGINAEKINVAECGVNHQFYCPDDPVVRFERPTLVYLGRIKKYKSVQHLLQAFPLIRRQITDAQAIIVGDGDYLPALKKLARKLNLEEAVTFTGYVSAEKKRDYLRRSHVAVYPSPKEGWGITNIEANACGTPVVAADVPGLRDSVDLGRSGFLYEYGNLPQLADNVLKILSNDELQRSLSAGALKWAARFTWDDCARRSFDCIEKTHDGWRKR